MVGNLRRVVSLYADKEYIVIGKIIARLNNCTLLNFRAFMIYLW